MKKYIPIVLLAAIGCRSAMPAQEKTTQPQNITANGKLFTALFQQQAAEYRALCLQAFSIARLRLDEALAASHSKPLAIVTDIDETLLDNSRYAVRQSLVGKDYEKTSWEAWTAEGNADTLSGAVAFLTYAKSKGVSTFYITNRAIAEQKGTLDNLIRFGFPDADASHLMLRDASSSKETRRQNVTKTHDIVLLMGDNLADFSPLFDKKTPDERENAVTALSAQFGKSFIVLPNPAYGDWETSLYQYKNELAPAQKDSLIKTFLKK